MLTPNDYTRYVFLIFHTSTDYILHYGLVFINKKKSKMPAAL